jgi:hypothetical protein
MAIGSFTVTLAAYVYVKRMGNVKQIMEEIAEYAPDMIKDLMEQEKTQKSIYAAGVLIGNGASSGFGLQKKSGKLGIQDLIMNAIGGMLNRGQQQGASQDGNSNPLNP